jgi:hypothetical protein
MVEAPEVNRKLTICWDWVYCAWDGEERSYDGGFVLQCSKPKKGKTITEANMSGTLTFGEKENQGRLTSIEVGSNKVRNAAWLPEFDWDPAGEDLGNPVEISWGKDTDENGNSFVIARFFDMGGTLLVGKRDPGFNAATYGDKKTRQELTDVEEAKLRVRDYAKKRRTEDDGESDESSEEETDGEDDSEEESIASRDDEIQSKHCRLHWCISDHENRQEAQKTRGFRR